MGPDIVLLPHGLTLEQVAAVVNETAKLTAKRIRKEPHFLKMELEFRQQELRDARRVLQRKEPRVRFLTNKVAALESDNEALRQELQAVRQELDEKTKRFWSYLNVDEVQTWK